MRRRKAPPARPPGSGPMTRKMRKPPPEDPISNLPDDLLVKIVSLLPTKDGARTQILASRWRDLWRSAPLNLDSAGLYSYGVDLAPVVSHILSSHPGPGRRFCVCRYHLESQPASVDAWLRSPALDNLQELDYTFFEQPPASVFRFSPSLRALTIGCCSLPDDTMSGLHFPLLKHLGLEGVRISELSLHSLIDGCPAMESLLIHACFGFRRVRIINSLTVRSIGVLDQSIYTGSDLVRLQELVIDNAPRLERLVRNNVETGLHVSVVAAPRLQAIGFLSDGYKFSRHCYPDHLYRLELGSTVIQGLRVESLAMAVSTVKILAFWTRNLCLDTIVELLKCFPCLEKLYIKPHMGIREPNNLWRRKHHNFIKRHDIRLKTLVLRRYWGNKSQVNFVTFFLLNSRMLESVTLQVERYNEEFVEDQRTKLQLENRASRAAQLHFTTHRSIRSSSDIKRVHDLDVVDPFEPPC